MNRPFQIIFRNEAFAKCGCNSGVARMCCQQPVALLGEGSKVEMRMILTLSNKNESPTTRGKKEK
jgi:hypothetical protein